MSSEVKVPALGESVAEASIGQWLKQPGEPVSLDEAIVSLETDKVAIEVTAPVAGVMGAQLAKVGDTVNVGAVIAMIEAGAGAVATAAAAPPAAVATPASDAAAQPRPRLLPPRQPHPTQPCSPPRCAAQCWNTASIRRRSPAPARTAA
jgi:2-oxoglutarate dehydrogenase E2 component (dihydrolipoamide succinyltransferase)